jgi:predicted deacetylase
MSKELNAKNIRKVGYRTFADITINDKDQIVEIIKSTRRKGEVLVLRGFDQIVLE